jgi:signal transduction histidine kinase/CheY-like chemotaxis protein
MQLADSVAEEFHHVLGMAAANPVVAQAEIDSLSAQFREYSAFARRTTLNLIAGASTDDLLPDVTGMVTRLNDLDAALEARTARDKANIIAAYETVERASARATMFVVLALILVVGVTALVAWSIARRVKASIDTVGRAASHIAAGDLRTGFDFGSQVQLAPLARPFAAIIDYIRTIAGTADRLARGDLSVKVSPRSEQDEVSVNLRQAIADRIAMEKSLRESEEVQQARRMEAIGRLAGGIAHDFNNLLTAIIGHTAILDDMLGPVHPAHESLVEVRRASDRAASLTRQLLAYGRKQVMHPKLVDLDGIVAEVIRMLRPMVREDISIEHVSGTSLGRVRIDPTQIEQVILNLVLNARDAMKDGGGAVTVTTRNADVTPATTRLNQQAVPAGRWIVLEVKDTGVGMDQATQDRIFEPFFTTKGLAGGAGLGLATVHGIVRQSGGEVEVRSTPGAGTTFSVYLPREDVADSVPADASAQDGTRRQGGGEVVLVAEDEAAVRAMIVRSLVQSGYRVIEAKNGADALEAANVHSGRIDVLLTDVVMPQMGGRELVTQLAPVRPGMKVIFMSGYSEDAVVQPELFDPQHRFIEKPFAPPLLARTIREVLDERARASEPQRPRLSLAKAG